MTDFTAAALVETFGSQTSLAQMTITALYDALTREPRHAPPPPPTLQLAPLAKRYPVDNLQPHLFHAVQTYHALVLTMLAAHYLQPRPSPPDVLDKAYFATHNVSNLLDDAAPYTWATAADLDMTALWQAVSAFTFSDPPPDALKVLYHDLFPRKVRHALGEYNTPDWLAQHTLDTLGYEGERRLLDPACGSGTFLTLALRCMATPDVSCIVGVDVNPLACLAAKVNVLLHLPRPRADDAPLHLPIYCADSILQPPPIAPVDVIATNPPWINWETLPESYRQQTTHLWQSHGLFAHSGMESILGKGKKDLSLLLTLVTAQRHLRAGGSLGAILPHSTLKTGGAGAGFRRLQLRDGTPLQVQHVDDFSRVKAFYRVSASAIVMTLRKGQPTTYPVPYTVWRRRDNSKPLYDDDTLATVQQKTRRSAFVAAPIDGVGSAWLSGKPAALNAVRKLIGVSDYTAHAGAYTGGANAVYWLDVLHADDKYVTVRNLVSAGKRKVPQVEATLERELVFPLLRGSDLTRWRAMPGAHILVAQNPQTRQGYVEAFLRTYAPRTYAYLAQFKDTLCTRAAYKRYFQQTAPFYTMFNVGTYTFAPYKVVWQGFGTDTMQAAVIGCIDDKPIMTNQALHPFIGLECADEAHYLAALLNSAPFEYAVLSHTQPGGKSFAQPGILQTLRLPRYDAANPVHRELMMLSRAAHAGTPDDAAIASAAAEVWQLRTAELRDIVQSLRELR